MAIARDAKLQLTDEMIERFRVAPGTSIKLGRWSTKWDVPAGLEVLNKQELKRQADEFVKERVRELADLQDVLWADGRYALLVVFQGLDASGKDSTIKHVTSGMNPAGVRVISFKEPSEEELRHNYLWRYVRALPEQGEIGVFNRSHYEEVCVVRVKPELLRARALTAKEVDDSFWREAIRFFFSLFFNFSYGLCFSERIVDFLRCQSPRTKELRFYAHDAHFLIVRAVEDSDFALFGERLT